MHTKEKKIISVVLLVAAFGSRPSKAEDCQALSDCMNEYSKSIHRLELNFNDQEHAARILNMLCRNPEALSNCYTEEKVKGCSVFDSLPKNIQSQDRIKKHMNLICSNEDGYIDFLNCFKNPEVSQYAAKCMTAVYKQIISQTSTSLEDKCTGLKAIDNCLYVALTGGDCKKRALNTYTTLAEENYRAICPVSSTVVMHSNLLLLVIMYMAKLVLL